MTGELMNGSKAFVIALVTCFALYGGWGSAGQHKASNVRRISPPNVDEARLINADREPGNWMGYGRTYSEQRFSPLKEIKDDNVGGLGLAWSFDLDTDRGQEATPIVV